MRRYWDLDESDRAGLTEDQVKEFLAYELMEKGVLRVEPLKVEDETPVELPTRRVYLLREGDGNYGVMLNVAFETVEAAEAARDSIAFIREQHGWQGPHFTRPVKPIQVVAEDLATEDAVTASKVALEDQGRRASRNMQARREFDEATKKASDATSGIWSDWLECRKDEARREKIRATLREYLGMTGGDEKLAREFLAKVFPVEEIVGACGGIPVLPPMAEPTPPPTRRNGEEILF